MTKPRNDTIAALATPAGRGGVAVLRISGPGAAAIARRVAGPLPDPRRAALRRFRDAAGEVLDEGLVLFFPAPRSFTGEDVVELHGHGGPVVSDLLLAAVLAAGARMAHPGEFSRRAFEHGRMDLAQAEAVADLIESGSAAAARAALRTLRGEFSERVAALAEALTGLRVSVEAALDFPEEEGVDTLSRDRVETRLGALLARLDELAAVAGQGALLREGMTVVLAGEPNAGKSSLLNRLTGQDTAIVSGLPGTTRDVLRERIAIDGLPLHVIDTAGLRDHGDEIELEGMRRTRREMAGADRVLLVVDAALTPAGKERPGGALPVGVPVTVVRNKIDLTGEPPGLEQGEPPLLRLSALTGAGLEALAAHLKACMGYRETAEGALLARRRHLDALARCRTAVAAACRQLLAGGSPELAAEELRLAQRALGEITGQVTSEDLLGRIFASFCIGK